MEKRKLFKLSTYKKVELIETVKVLAVLLAVAVFAEGFLAGILIELVK